MSAGVTQYIVGLGELLWDCFADCRRPGGAPANVAFHAQQLGYRSVVCSRLGADPDGCELRSYLAQRGLTTDSIQTDPDHPTGRVTVDSTDPSRPAFTIHENVAWDYLAFDEAWRALMHQAAAVCFGTLAQRGEISRASIQLCLTTAANALRVYDVNLRPPWYDRQWIVGSLEVCHIAKLNQEEAVLLSDLLDVGAHDPTDFGQRLRSRFNLDLVCVTRGERGCVLVGPDEVADVPGRPVKVADAVGAGDAFSAALICGRLQNWPLATIAEFANQVGGLVAGQSGAMPDLADEYQTLIEAYGVR